VARVPDTVRIRRDGRDPRSVPATCHIFYGQRVIDVDDGLPKWAGHKNASDKIDV